MEVSPNSGCRMWTWWRPSITWWYFAYDKIHYGRFLPNYHAQMSRLSIDNPDVYMSTSWKVASQFNWVQRIPLVEFPLTRPSKRNPDTWRTKGFSLKPAAVSQYYLTAEYQSNYPRKLNRLEKDPPTAKFHDKLTKLNLKTFSHLNKTKISKAKSKEVVLKADRNLFRHMVIVAQSRQLHERCSSTSLTASTITLKWWRVSPQDKQSSTWLLDSWWNQSCLWSYMKVRKAL